MSLKTKVKKVEIEDKEYLMTIDMLTIQYFKDKTNQSFLKAITSLTEMDETILFPLMGGMLRNVEEPNVPLGVEFLGEFDPLAMINYLTPFLGELIALSMPTAQNGQASSKKKKK